MSTIKISELTELSSVSNTDNILFVGVDTRSNTTGKISGTKVSRDLYNHNNLNVGNNEILLSNTIAQFSGNVEGYLQVNLQNFRGNGSADYVVTSDIGTDDQNYIDLGILNSSYNVSTQIGRSSQFDGMGTAGKPFDGYLYVKGTDNNGNLIIGTFSTGTEIRVIAGGADSSNIVLTVSNTGIKLVNNSFVTFSDNTQQKTASLPTSVTQAIFDYANTVNAYAVSANTWLQGNDRTTLTASKSYTDSSNTWLQSNDFSTLVVATDYTDSTSSWLQGNDRTTLTVAENYTDTTNTWIRNQFIANTSTTLDGTLTLTHGLYALGPIAFSNSTFSADSAALDINASGGIITLPSSDGYMLHVAGKQNVTTRIILDSCGSGGNTFNLIEGRSARGNSTYPTAIKSGDIMLRMSGSGHNGTSFTSPGSSRIDLIATENYSNTSMGSQIKFYNCVNGSNTFTNTAIFYGYVYPQKGFIMLSNTVPSTITTLALDITNTSMIRCNITSALAITPYNFYPGKLVDVWVTNSATGNRVVTHGLLDINSTVSATNFTMSASSLAYLRYYSVESDSANTYVSINFK